MSKSCSPHEFLCLARRRERDGHLSTWRQILDILRLRTFHGVGPGFYQMAGFWRRNLTWEDKTGSLSAKEYRKVVYRLNPPHYQKFSQNKVAEKSLLRLFGIPASEYLGLYDPVYGRGADGKPLRSPAELAVFLSALEEHRRICFKPIEGWGGHGFEIAEIDRIDAAVRLRRVKTGELLDVDEFCAAVPMGIHGGTSVIESFLEQHELMSRFNPSSVNTLRIWAIRENRSVRVLLGFLRIGRSGSLVDNTSSGGIVAPLDLTTGKLGAAIDGLPTRNVFSVHPDHGTPIEGETIPHINECLELAKSALLVFHPLRFAGLDIAVATDGPRIIELNVNPDREGAAQADVRTRELFQAFL